MKDLIRMICSKKVGKKVSALMARGLTKEQAIDCIVDETVMPPTRQDIKDIITEVT